MARLVRGWHRVTWAVGLAAGLLMGACSPPPSPTSADQRTFFVGEKSTGSGFFEVVTPVQLRPRHCGQSSATNG